MGKKLLGVLLLGIVLLTCGGSPVTSADADGLLQSERQAEQVINAYSLHAETVYTIARSVPLKSFATGAYEYTLYELAPYGYAILYDATTDLMEACYEPDTLLPVAADETAAVFYAGPGNYYAYDGAALKNTIDGSTLDYEGMAQLAALETEAQRCSKESAASLSVSDAMSPQSSVVPSTDIVKKYVQKSYFENLDRAKGELGNNNGTGTCTVIAVQMLLGYYDNFICDQYVEAKYECGKGTNEAFHLLLNDYVYGDDPVGGIYIRNAAAGINTYLSERGISARLLSEHSTLAKARDKIFNSILSGQPVIASMSTIHGAEYDHSVLVYGVQYDPEIVVSASQAKFVVHMGWGINTAAYVTSGSWYYECGYLSHNTHSYGLWKQNGSATHKRVCPCGAAQTESHAGYWNASTKKCSRCGYVGNISTVSSGQYPQ